MMLRFYSYFKQATLGPCTQKKPPFWDVVGRYENLQSYHYKQSIIGTDLIENFKLDKLPKQHEKNFIKTKSKPFDIKLRVNDFIFFDHRAKYDSYKSLGKMPKERAMELYVEELKKIIETMSYTDNVAEFMGSINELDGVDVDDLEAVAPDAIKKVRSQPNSPFGKLILHANISFLFAL